MPMPFNRIIRSPLFSPPLSPRPGILSPSPRQSDHDSDNSVSNSDTAMPSTSGSTTAAGTSESTTDTDKFLQSLLEKGKTQEDSNGVRGAVNAIFQYVAPRTNFLSEKLFKENLEKISDDLEGLHKTWMQNWKREMFEAVHSQNLWIVRKLVNVNGFDINGEIDVVPQEEFGVTSSPICNHKHTALTYATWMGYLTFVKKLVEEGALPDAFTSENLNAFDFASMRDSTLPILKYFVEDVGVHPGDAPLITASSYGAYECCKYLLLKRCSINFQDSKGLSALHHATIGGHLHIIKLLVSFGAAIYLRDDKYRNVLHQLMLHANSPNISRRVLQECLEYFVVERGFGVNWIMDNGSTALHEACHLGLFDAAKFLIEHGAKVESIRKGWETPLWSLVMGECPKKDVKRMVTLLLEKGAKFDRPNCLGMSVIEYAQKISGDFVMAEALQDAFRSIKFKRMKAMGERRRQILSGTFKDEAQPQEKKALQCSSTQARSMSLTVEVDDDSEEDSVSGSNSSSSDSDSSGSGSSSDDSSSGDDSNDNSSVSESDCEEEEEDEDIKPVIPPPEVVEIVLPPSPSTSSDMSVSSSSSSTSGDSSDSSSSSIDKEDDEEEEEEKKEEKVQEEEKEEEKVQEEEEEEEEKVQEDKKVEPEKVVNVNQNGMKKVGNNKSNNRNRSQVSSATYNYNGDDDDIIEVQEIVLGNVGKNLEQLRAEQALRRRNKRRLKELQESSGEGVSASTSGSASVKEGEAKKRRLPGTDCQPLCIELSDSDG